MHPLPGLLMILPHSSTESKPRECSATFHRVLCLISAYMCLHVWYLTRGGQRTVCGESFLSFYHVGPTQVFRLSGKHLFLLSHLSREFYMHTRVYVCGCVVVCVCVYVQATNKGAMPSCHCHQGSLPHRHLRTQLSLKFGCAPPLSLDPEFFVRLELWLF